MQLRFGYAGWDPAEPLDPDAAGAVRFLETLAAGGRLADTGEVVAGISDYGVVSACIPVDARCELFVQVGGDGWDRLGWTARSGRAYEWTWSPERGPVQVEALLDGRAIERRLLFGKRLLETSLIVNGESVDRAGALLPRLVRRSGVPLRQQDVPAL